jgi:hypothetical protein
MTEKYTPMKTPCDLGRITLDVAIRASPPMFLHVHPSQLKRAKEIVTAGSLPEAFWRVVPEVISDATLFPNEWYLTTAIGSKATDG